MKEIVKIINELKETNSTKDKQFILEKNKDNEMLKKILLYTYDPFKRYGISEKILDSLLDEVNIVDLPYNLDLFNFLDLLSTTNSNNRCKREIAAYIKYAIYEHQLIYKGIFLKDLRAGISTSTINKVWPNLIPKFEVQLAKKYNDVKLINEEQIFITEKFDGIRCVAIKDKLGIKLFTRQGKEITGLIDIENTILPLFRDTVVLDGELVAENPNNLNSGDLYNATKKIVSSKSDKKIGIIFNVFDILTLNEFKKGFSDNIYSIRRYILDTHIPKTGCVKVAPLLYHGIDHSMIISELRKAEMLGKEGVMVNRDKIYECKRTNNLLKVKTMNTVDLKIIGYKEGTGRNKDSLGAFIVDYKGFSVDVGSGFSDIQRAEFFDKKDELMGRIIEVQYFEETKNEKGGISLRFPVFRELREIGKEVSYN